MTENTNTFAARLRELSRLASAGPWFGGHLSETDDGCDCTYVLNEHRCGSIATFSVAKEGDEYAAEYPTKAECIANMALTNTLRNAADRLADLVERVKAYREATDVRETFSAEGPHDDTMTLARLCTAEANAYRAMLAALDALNGGGA